MTATELYNTLLEVISRGDGDKVITLINPDTLLTFPANETIEGKRKIMIHG